MKTLNELYNEVTASDELKAEFLALKAPEELVAFAKKHSCDVTLDDIKAFFAQKQKEAGELSDTELEQVAGGKSSSFGEGFFSFTSAGVLCLSLAITSLIAGKVGTAIEGRGMICAEDDHEDSMF